mgnify:CR=1 FL=1
MGLFSKDNIVGIDVGSVSARVVELKAGMGKNKALVAFGSSQFPEKLAQSDSKVDQQKVAHILKNLVKTSRVSTNKGAGALPASDVFTAVIKMPPMTTAELAKAVHYQAEQNIPLKIEDVKIDWQIVRENPTTREKAVMIIAAPKVKINKTMELFDMAGLDLIYLETTPVAVARAISRPTDPLVMIVDIGALATELTIVENNIVTHVRSIPAAGHSLTNVISKNLGLDESQAEQFKRKFGLSQDKLEGQVFKTMRPVLDTIIEEIKRSIKYYQEQFGGNIEKVVLTGGSSNLLEIISYFKTMLGTEVVFGNAWVNVSYPANLTDKINQNASEFAAAVGLAMREG